MELLLVGRAHTLARGLRLFLLLLLLLLLLTRKLMIRKIIVMNFDCYYALFVVRTLPRLLSFLYVNLIYRSVL